MSTVRLEPSVQSVAVYPLRYRTVPILKTFVDDFFNHENIHCQQREMTNTSQSRNNWSRITSICQKKKNNYVLIMRQFETNHKKAFGTVYTLHSMYIFVYCNAEILQKNFTLIYEYYILQQRHTIYMMFRGKTQ